MIILSWRPASAVISCSRASGAETRARLRPSEKIFSLTTCIRISLAWQFRAKLTAYLSASSEASEKSVG